MDIGLRESSVAGTLSLEAVEVWREGGGREGGRGGGGGGGEGGREGREGKRGGREGEGGRRERGRERESV